MALVFLVSRRLQSSMSMFSSRNTQGKIVLKLRSAAVAQE